MKSLFNDELIKGIFIGALLCCWFMVLWPKDLSCTISVQRGQQTTVYMGKSNDY